MEHARWEVRRILAGLSDERVAELFPSPGVGPPVEDVGLSRELLDTAIGVGAGLQPDEVNRRVAVLLEPFLVRLDRHHAELRKNRT